jgi:pilus assembly protein CpaB
MGRRTLLLIASILVAALGTALIWLYVQGADKNARQAAALTSVLFLAQAAPEGTDAGSLVLVSKDVSAAAATGAVTSRVGLSGLKLNTPGIGGQILLKSMLGTQNARFPRGGAVALAVTDPNRVPADLTPGDVVDVYAYGGRLPGLTRVVTRVQVRTIGPARVAGATAGGSNGSVPPTIVGFDVNSQDAQKLYGIVAAGQQAALYDTGTGPPAP